MTRTIRKKNDSSQTQSGGKSGLWSSIGLLVLGVGLVVAGVWRSIERVEPPTIQPDGVDKAIVAAVAEARKAVLDSPKKGETWGELGMVLLAHEFNDQAREAFTKAAELSPTDPRWPYYQGRSLATTKPQDAIRYLEQTVQICGDKPPAPRLTLIELLLEQGELDKAGSQLAQALAADPNNARAKTAKARLSFMQGDFQACHDILTQLNQQLQQMYVKGMTQAKQLTEKGNRSAAQSLVQKLQVQINNASGKMQTSGLLLSEAMRRIGMTEDAEKQRKFALSKPDRSWPDPFWSEVGRRRTGLKFARSQADILYGNQRYDEAKKLLQVAVEQYPTDLFARIFLGRSLIREGRVEYENGNQDQAMALYRQAETQLAKAQEIDPQSVDAIFRMGVLQLYIGEATGDKQLIQRAADLYREAIRIKPDFTMAHYNLGLCLRQLEDLPGAINALEMAVASQPDNADALAALAELLISAERYDEAKEKIEMALSINPDHPRAMRLKASLPSSGSSE